LQSCFVAGKKKNIQKKWLSAPSFLVL
jgi:hypothetical protein